MTFLKRKQHEGSKDSGIWGLWMGTDPYEMQLVLRTIYSEIGIGFGIVEYIWLNLGTRRRETVVRLLYKIKLQYSKVRLDHLTERHKRRFV